MRQVVVIRKLMAAAAQVAARRGGAVIFTASNGRVPQPGPVYFYLPAHFMALQFDLVVVGKSLN